MINKQTRRCGKWAAAAGLVLLSATVAVPAGAQTAETKTLRVAADPSIPPFAYKTPSGTIEGFNIELAQAVATQMGMKAELVPQDWSGIFAGLFAGHYDVIVAPVTATPERAESMAFTEGYIETAIAFLSSKSEPITSLADLKGKVVSLNNGSISDTWATKNAEQYGFTIQRYLNVPDSIQAVQTKRSQAALADLGAVAHIAKQQPSLALGHVVNIGGAFAFAVKPERTDLRNEVDRALECLKSKGKVAELYKKWFGKEPASDSPSVKPVSGYGVPGLKHYADTPHDPVCK